jgi:hypothetical protein
VTEGTPNSLVNRLMNKQQQMRWSRRGADLLLQVRCGGLQRGARIWFGNLFEPTPDTAKQLPLAALRPPHFGHSHGLLRTFA